MKERALALLRDGWNIEEAVGSRVDLSITLTLRRIGTLLMIYIKALMYEPHPIFGNFYIQKALIAAEKLEDRIATEKNKDDLRWFKGMITMNAKAYYAEVQVTAVEAVEDLASHYRKKSIYGSARNTLLRRQTYEISPR
ncbi:hypothetical protein F5887DRAFT_1072989 [Amanita rubescens]|nr:hypothetical protein F5887DRAFT_1072989 [Amanita rubescens]